jgi:hypothetical protein
LQFFRLSALQNCEFQGCFPKTEVLGKPPLNKHTFLPAACQKKQVGTRGGVIKKICPPIANFYREFEALFARLLGLRATGPAVKFSGPQSFSGTN